MVGHDAWAKTIPAHSPNSKRLAKDHGNNFHRQSNYRASADRCSLQNVMWKLQFHNEQQPWCPTRDMFQIAKQKPNARCSSMIKRHCHYKKQTAVQACTVRPDDAQRAETAEAIERMQVACFLPLKTLQHDIMHYRNRRVIHSSPFLWLKKASNALENFSSFPCFQVTTSSRTRHKAGREKFGYTETNFKPQAFLREQKQVHKHHFTVTENSRTGTEKYRWFACYADWRKSSGCW
jgi:hypothetical protein